MNRRKALTLTAALMGGTIIGSEVWLTGCTSPERKTGLLSEEDILFLDEVGETILPKTDRSPGAKETRIGEFMRTIVIDCYDDAEQKVFIDGIQKINDLSKKNFSLSFLNLSSDEKFLLLAELDMEAKEFKSEENSVPHYFTLMKQLTIWGYFTSEPGNTLALKYNPVPGRYEGCVTYVVGEKAWA